MLRGGAATRDWVYGTRGRAPLRDGVAPRRGLELGGFLSGAAPRSSDETTGPAREVGRAAARLQNLGCASLPTANIGRRGRVVCEEIITHRLRALFLFS